MTQSETSLGWIGTGVMGESMCRHLMALGSPMHICTRTPQKAQALIQEGAHWCETPQEVAEKADIVFTMVGFPEDVRQVYFSSQGLLKSCRKGHIFVDMTTTKPSLAVDIAHEMKAVNAGFADAPVSGGDVGAREARLSIMVGAESDTFEKLQPYFDVMGKTIVHQGPPGSGQHTKMCNQIVIAGTMIGVCESLVYAAEANLDLPTMLSSITGGAASCWTLDNLAPRILNEDYEPGFYIDHFVKDMGVALSECESMNIQLKGLELVHRLYEKCQSMGLGQKGTQALILALKEMAQERQA